MPMHSKGAHALKGSEQRLRPIDRARRRHAAALLAGAALLAARCALETVGADRFIFGTDAPPLKVLKRAGVAVIKELNLPPDDERKVFGGNAAKLLRI
jgi:predicted TIM-barrel fold metal-dependent hydrolase